MLRLNGYSIPADLFLIMKVLCLLLFYSASFAARPMPDILRKIRSLRKKSCSPTAETAMVLDKVWRACNFFLLRIAASDKPCLRRALVMYNYCCRMGLDAEVMIGVKKDGCSLTGHGWIEIDGVPYLENRTDLDNYTVMLKG
jgi:hypothetical protein